MPEQYLSFSMMVVKRGDVHVLGTGKAYQKEPLHLEGRSVLTGINHLKNALKSCVMEMHLEIAN
jgi:hypothetical protein